MRMLSDVASVASLVSEAVSEPRGERGRDDPRDDDGVLHGVDDADD